MAILLEDTFAGTTIDTGKWSNAVSSSNDCRVTQNDQIQLESFALVNGTVRGCSLYSFNSYTFTGTLRLLADFIPCERAGDSDYYTTIKFAAAAANRNAVALIDESFAAIRLGASGDTTDRTSIGISEAVSGAVDSPGTLLASVDIAVANSTSVPIVIDFDTSTGKITVNINNGESCVTATISSTVLSAIGSTFILDIGFHETWVTASMEVFDNILLSAMTGLISGVVKEEGAAVARTVNLHDRATGRLLATTTSSAGDGTFTFTVSDTSTEYYVVALDDAAGAVYNALIYDRITGV